MNEVLKVDYSSISALRNDYLNSLAVFQDVFLELKALSSEYFGIESEEKVIGYAICSADQVLIEFYLKPDFIRQCSFYFNLIISRLGVKRIYCQSFDTLLLNCCIQNNFPYHTEGWLFRDFYQTENYFSNAIQMRFAEEPDYHFFAFATGWFVRIVGRAGNTRSWTEYSDVFFPEITLSAVVF